MEMHKYVKQDAAVEQDMTPMIDIVFLLIIFFMVVTEMSNLDIEELVLPLATQAKDQEKKPGTREIKINVVLEDSNLGTGKIKISGDEYDAKELKRKLRLEVEVYGQMEKNPKNPDQEDSLLEVLVRADQGVNSKYIHQIYAACKEAKIFKVRLAALSERLDDPYSGE